MNEFVEWLPEVIRKNPEIFGFIIYKEDIWKYFIVHILFFAIGVYVRKQLNLWKQDQEKERL